jgi:Uma2 family endonuclease
LLGERWLVDPEICIGLPTSVPEPDVTVYRGRLEDYLSRRPNPGDVGMLVEVADSTLSRDRNWKRRIYAKAGIPVYWIVNLIDRVVEVYSHPSAEGASADYRPRVTFEENSRVPVVLDGTAIGEILIADILPPL